MGEANHTSSVASANLHHIVAIPFPGRGHIHPMLSLCHRLASRGCIAITFVVTEEWLSLLFSTPSPLLHENIRVQSIPNVLPSEKTRGANYEAFIMAVLTKMGAPVEDVMKGFDAPVDAILADSLLPWAPLIGKKREIPVSAFFPQSATMLLALLHLSSAGANGQSLPELVQSDEAIKHLEYLPRPSSAHLSDFMAAATGQDNTKSFIKAISWSLSAPSLLFNSPFELETQAINALNSKLSLPIYTIGPSVLNMTTLRNNNSFAHSDWLDAQPPNSVLYVSLGSFLPVSPQQMGDIASGLCMSGVRFLLVAREEQTRMQELSGELGLVVPWADQLETLCHPSVGGFLTHCGWNSVLEGVYAGVPMLTFPLMWDQFPNSKLVVDEWKVGLRLSEACADGFVGREEIAKIAKKFMDLEFEEGKEIRERVKEMKKTCGLALEEKGSSSHCTDAFVQGIVSSEDAKDLNENLNFADSA